MSATQLCLVLVGVGSLKLYEVIPDRYSQFLYHFFETFAIHVAVIFDIKVRNKTDIKILHFHLDLEPKLLRLHLDVQTVSLHGSQHIDNQLILIVYFYLAHLVNNLEVILVLLGRVYLMTHHAFILCSFARVVQILG